jgi:hypothetical protein
MKTADQRFFRGLFSWANKDEGSQTDHLRPAAEAPIVTTVSTFHPQGRAGQGSRRRDDSSGLHLWLAETDPAALPGDCRLDLYIGLRAGYQATRDASRNVVPD